MSRVVLVSLPGAKPAAGGLATAMLSALRESGGLWFGWSGETVEGPVGATRLCEQDGITYATVDLQQAVGTGIMKAMRTKSFGLCFITGSNSLCSVAASSSSMRRSTGFSPIGWCTFFGLAM